LPVPLAAPPRLTEFDFVTAANTLGGGVEVAGIMAVAQVEAGGRRGFGPAGRPIIRYELHIFQGRTGGIYHATHPHLSQPTLAAGNPYHTGGQTTEWSLMHGSDDSAQPHQGPADLRCLAVGFVGDLSSHGL
jgi:hypothetical protein